MSQAHGIGHGRGGRGGVRGLSHPKHLAEVSCHTAFDDSTATPLLESFGTRHTVERYLVTPAEEDGGNIKECRK
jgi:hypothetical protein